MLIMLAESRHRRCKLLRHPANAGLIRFKGQSNIGTLTRLSCTRPRFYWSRRSLSLSGEPRRRQSDGGGRLHRVRPQRFTRPKREPILAPDVLNYAIAFSSRTSLICLLQPLDVEFDHFQHCFGNALGARPIRILHHIAEHRGRDLPEEPLAVFQPPTLLDLSAFRQRRPEPVNFCLIVALNNERYGMFPAPIGAYQWCPPFRGRVTASPKGDAVVYVSANAYA